MTRGLFVTASGTACGKTWLSRGLARALVLQGRTVAALKPLETGLGDGPTDAQALARASGRPELAAAVGLVRLPLAVSPYAAARAASQPIPSPTVLAARLHELVRGSDAAIVEGAGGLLVPLSREHTMADLAVATGWPIVLVGRDALGTLSHLLTALESAERRALHVRAVVLVRGPWSVDDPSVASNATILAERVPLPVHVLPVTADEDDALARAVAPMLPTLFP